MADRKTQAVIQHTLSYFPSRIMAAAFTFCILCLALLTVTSWEEASSTSTCEAGKNGPILELGKGFSALPLQKEPEGV